MSPLAAPSAVLALLGVSSLTWGRSAKGGLFSFEEPFLVARSDAFSRTLAIDFDFVLCGKFFTRQRLLRVLTA